MGFNHEAARNIIGIMGNVISFAMFASPIPTFVEIWKNKSVREFKSDPYLATILNCMLWNFYGWPIVNPGNTLIITVNGVGLALELIYITIFYIYAPKKERMKVTGCVLMELVFMAGLVFFMLKFVEQEQRSTIVGIFCVIINFLMYTSPLTVMRKVITTKSVKYMPFWLSLAILLNGTIWSLYAVIDTFDLYILIGSVPGALSGVIQLILYACYYKANPNPEVDEIVEKPTELQLSITDDVIEKPTELQLSITDDVKKPTELQLSISDDVLEKPADLQLSITVEEEKF